MANPKHPTDAEIARQHAISHLEALGAISGAGEDQRNLVYCSQAILDVLEDRP